MCGILGGEPAQEKSGIGVHEERLTTKNAKQRKQLKLSARSVRPA
jgi:hypothetical protein